MTNKEKRLLKTGILLLLGVPLVILIINDIPQLIRHLNNINLSSGDAGYYTISLILIFILCIPLLISGSVCVARSILSWQKARYINLMTVLFTILIMFCVIMLGVGVFILAGFIWRGFT